MGQTTTHTSFTWLLALVCISLAAACGIKGAADVADLPQRLVISGDDISDRAVELHEMPTPNELFSLIDDLIGHGSSNELAPVLKAQEMVDKHTRAFNFGMYATDLTYASHFGMSAEVVRYYIAMKQLGEGMSIGSAFQPDDMRKLEHHLSNGDSLQVLSDEYYRKAYEQLEDEDKGPELAMALAGGWVETCHLLLQHIDKSEGVLVQRLADQKVTLEHLLVIMLQFEDIEDLKPVRGELLAVLEIFDQLDVHRLPNKDLKQDSRIVVSSDQQRVFTPQKLADLRSAINTLRTHMIRDHRTTNNNA